MLNNRERGGREPALRTREWDLRHLPARGGRVATNWGRTGFLCGKRSASPDRRGPSGASEWGAGGSPGSGVVNGGR